MEVLATYGNSQTRGQTGAGAAGLCHSHGNRSEPHLRSMPQLAATSVRSLTHWARLGIEPTSSQRPYQVLNLLGHSRNSYLVLNSSQCIFFFFLFGHAHGMRKFPVLNWLGHQVSPQFTFLRQKYLLKMVAVRFIPAKK